MDYKLPIKVFDFFSGCGGTSQGFKQAGMDIVFALDSDKDSQKTFERNFPGTHFECKAIEDFAIPLLKPFLDLYNNYPKLFSGCAPCQPFTRQKTIHPKNDNRITLLQKFQRFVEAYEPEYVFVENVPGIQKMESGSPIDEFVRSLKDNGYFCKVQQVFSQDYGVPQRRKRLVLIASRLGQIDFPPKTNGPQTNNSSYITVREAIYDLPAINAGEIHPDIPNHQAASLTDINLERIKATPKGGSRSDWPDDLILACHKNGYKGHTDVYGRMDWDAPATGLTTRCISLSNGRFGHPEQDRAISVREAACLQTFPRDFSFYGNLNSMARQIGNAVPVLMAQRFGENFNKHLCELIEDENNG